ncbi:MAG: phospho-sugar mutase [Calditrichia bacterium]
MNNDIRNKAEVWLGSAYDSETSDQVQNLIDNDPKELADAFYKDLEFGTGGLRGVMGVGTNRMNKYTVGIATQGLANYLRRACADLDEIKVAIAYDSRNNSSYFAEVTANVLSANGISVYLFEKLRPLPELSFTIRHLGCQSGVVVTASHNPKEYNGYKVFWEDGAQIVPPHDRNIIGEAGSIEKIEDVKFDGNPALIHSIGEEIDAAYLAELKKLTLSPESIENHKNLKILYTPLHGSGIMLVPQALKAYGFETLLRIPEQEKPDGNFPTVSYPNPEEPSVFKMALEVAKKEDVDLIMATDPDADRTAVVAKNTSGEYTILSGNQTAAILSYYLLTKWQEKGRLKGKEFIVKTIVTTELLPEIAKAFNVECYDVLTGFKWIADVIRRNEGKKTFIAGGEESIGFLIGDFRRDKDGVSTCAMVAEVAAWAADQGKTLYELMIEIYSQYGHYKDRLISLVKKGADGASEIKQMMADYRSQPMSEINGSKVIALKDYQSGITKNLVTGEEQVLDLPKSNVLQFFLEDGSKVSVRPSGTEPKIKYYFEVRGQFNNVADFDKAEAALVAKLDDLVASLGLS